MATNNRCRACDAEFVSPRPSSFCSKTCRNAGNRQKAIDLGLCGACRKNKARPGMSTCGQCKVSNASREDSFYRQRIASGRCMSCGKPRERNDRVNCAHCAKKAVAKVNRIRAARKTDGLCLRCGKQPPAHGGIDCEACNRQSQLKRISLKREVFAAYGGSVCKCCGVTEIVFLSIDHINGGGNAHRKELKDSQFSGWNFYRYLKKQGFPSGYQVLCFNCNAAKHILGKCPHQE